MKRAADDKITAYALGEITGEERVRVEQELAASAELRAEVMEIQEVAARLKVEFDNEPSPAPTINVRDLWKRARRVAAIQVKGFNSLAAIAALLLALMIWHSWFAHSMHRAANVQYTTALSADPSPSAAPMAPTSPLSLAKLDCITAFYDVRPCIGSAAAHDESHGQVSIHFDSSPLYSTENARLDYSRVGVRYELQL